MNKYIVEGMSCSACQARVERVVKKINGVKEATVSLLTKTLVVDGEIDDNDIIKAVEKLGYTINKINNGYKNVNNDNTENTDDETNEILKDVETPILKKRLCSSLIFLAILMYISMGHMMWNFPIPSFFDGNHIGLTIIQMLLALIIMLINKKFFTNGFSALFHLSPNMDSLVALGSSTAFIWSFFILMVMSKEASIGDTTNLHMLMMNIYFESAGTIVTLITVGKLLESISKGKTTNALKELIKLTPNDAIIEINENGKNIEKKINIKYLKLNDIVIIKPGEKIPIDGKIVFGNTSINESAITGESIPVDKIIGDNVYGGTLNEQGYIKIEVTKSSNDTAISQIIEMVKTANSTKAPIQRIADKISSIFVPTIICISIITFIIWWFINNNLQFALTRAISVLVVSCPCALGLATPVAIMVSSGVGAKNGILFKNAESIEKLAKIKSIAFDKTGTITEGRPKVIDVWFNEDTKNETNLSNTYLSIFYNIEKMSEHPLAKSVVEYINNLDMMQADTYSNNIKALNSTNVSGFGLNVDLSINGINDKFYAGNMALLKNINENLLSQNLIYSNDKTLQNNMNSNIHKALDIINTSISSGKTILLFFTKTKLYGLITVADIIREGSDLAIKNIKDMGIKTYMLTGDNKKVAENIGNTVKIDEIFSEVLPQDKGNIIEKIKKKSPLAMVGDGINDAVALSLANVGISISNGSKIAIDGSDIVLMNDNLLSAYNAINLSKKTLKNIYENYFWAFIYNLLLIPIAAGMYINLFNIEMTPDFAALAMSLSSFSVVINSLRINMTKMKHITKNS